MQIIWEIGENDNAFLVQSIKVCKTCKRHKVISWIGKDVTNAKNKALERVIKLNEKFTNPSKQIDIRPSGYGCDHYDYLFE